MKCIRCAVVVAAISIPLFVQARQGAIRYVPDNLKSSEGWLAKLKDAQVAAMTRVQAFHDFQFVDRLAGTGITFRHRIVEDAGRTYKAAHYDHGNGLAVA